jgi:methyl-accepting chemotaxis protein
MNLWRLVLPYISRRHSRSLAHLAEEVAGHWPHLPALETQIRETMRDVESSVVEVCSGFEGMAMRARDSVASASQLLGSDKGTGIEALLEASRRSMSQLRQQIDRSQQISSQLMERMKTLESSAGAIVKALAEIDRIAFGSKLVALNAKVEAAHFGERGAAFEVVADEIAKQARQSEQITESVADEMQRLRATVAATSTELEEMARMSVETLEVTRNELEGSLGELTHTHSQMESALAESVERGGKLADEIARSIMALQFQDRIGQRLGHVADELASMRETIHLPLELLTKETPVLGQARRQEVEARLESRYTMDSERTVSDRKKPVEETEMEGVELF